MPTCPPLLFELLPGAAGQPSLACTRSDRRAASVVLVHGACCDARIWAPLMRSLRALGIPSAAVSLRGHGGSEGREHLQGWGIDDYERDVMRVLGTLAEPHPVLVGHSMGGLVAQRVAARFDLRGLVLMASSPVEGMARDGRRMALRHPLTFLAAARKKSFLRLYQDPAVCRALLLGPSAPAALLDELRAGLGEESWLAGSQMSSVLPDPGRVRCPVTVLGGRQDRMVSASSTERTAQAYGVRVRWFDGAGHMLPLEVPGDRLTLALLRSWSGPAGVQADALATAHP